MLIPGAVLQGRYRIIRQIGGGGQALVYLAEDINLGSLRAIKELTPDPNASPQERQAAYDQFQREARILARLNHPNLLQVWDHFRVGDNAYLVMDYIDGQTLQEIMDQSLRFLPETAILRWAGQLCDVLDYLHRQHPPIIFRDLKPSNVMLDRSDTVKLIDFGIVRLFKPGKKTDTLKMGTMGYAPPEQYAGKGQTDARSDVYSLGATLHHLLTKRDPTQHPPFSFNTAPPRSLNPAVSPHVEAAITKALAYDRVHRFQSALEMKRALMDTPTAPTPTVAIPCPAQTPKRRKRRLRPGTIAALASLFVMLCCLGMVFFVGIFIPSLRATPMPTGVALSTPTPRPTKLRPTPTLIPPTSTPILASKPAFEVKKVRHAWSTMLDMTCIHAAVEIKNRGNRAVKLRHIAFTIYDLNGEVLEAISTSLHVPRIIRPGEVAYTNGEAVREDLEPGKVGELKVNFDYDLTSEEPQLLMVKNLSGSEGDWGYRVTGEVVNTSGESAGEIWVAVALYDEGNNLLGVLYAHPQVTLAPRDRVGFVALSACGFSPEIGKQAKRLIGVAYNLKL